MWLEAMDMEWTSLLPRLHPGHSSEPHGSGSTLPSSVLSHSSEEPQEDQTLLHGVAADPTSGSGESWEGQGEAWVRGSQ